MSPWAPRATSPLLVLALTVATALAVPATAPAKQKKISGKLSERGYTVIAIAASGEATSDRAPKGEFGLRPPAGKVSLHLRVPDGRYGGPIVLGSREHGKRAIVGVKAGADLGKLEVRAGKGYAKVKKAPENAINANRQARAKGGAPIGAGNIGLVRSQPPKDAPRGDLDFDGITNSLDIDDDGDLIVDNVDRKSPKARTLPAATASADFPGFPDGSYMTVGTSMQTGGDLRLAVNANGGSTDAEIAAAQPETERMGFSFEGFTDGNGEIDCGALVYCSPGGTGQLVPSLGAPPWVTGGLPRMLRRRR